MKKQIIIGFIIIFMLTGSLIRSAPLESGEAVIFLKDGNIIIGEIEDISSRRLVLELEDGTEVELANIWMINFINKQWYFAKERKKIVTSQHYFFLKDENIISGKLIDLSSRRKVFELETGEEIGIDSVKRIYLSKEVPDKFIKKPITVKKPIKKIKHKK